MSEYDHSLSLPATGDSTFSNLPVGWATRQRGADVEGLADDEGLADYLLKPIQDRLDDYRQAIKAYRQGNADFKQQIEVYVPALNGLKAALQQPDNLKAVEDALDKVHQSALDTVPASETVNVCRQKVIDTEEALKTLINKIGQGQHKQVSGIRWQEVEDIQQGIEDALAERDRAIELSELVVELKWQVQQDTDKAIRLAKGLLKNLP